MIIRCPKCNKLLYKGELKGYLRFEIICPRCRHRIVSEINTGEYTVRSYRKRSWRNHGERNQSDNTRED